MYDISKHGTMYTASDQAKQTASKILAFAVPYGPGEVFYATEMRKKLPGADGRNSRSPMALIRAF